MKELLTTPLPRRLHSVLQSRRVTFYVSNCGSLGTHRPTLQVLALTTATGKSSYAHWRRRHRATPVHSVTSLLTVALQATLHGDTTSSLQSAVKRSPPLPNCAGGVFQECGHYGWQRRSSPPRAKRLLRTSVRPNTAGVYLLRVRVCLLLFLFD